MPELGERIRAAREEAGLTDAALAQRLGLSATTVYLWESGMLHPSTRLQDIADATGKEVAWFGADLAPESAPPLPAGHEPSVERASDEPSGAWPGGTTAEPEQESEPESDDAAAADERERDLEARRAEIEAQATSVAEERQTLARERERLLEEAPEHARRLSEEAQALSEREAELARKTAEREQALAARVTELGAQAASLAEERDAVALERERLKEEGPERARRLDALAAGEARLAALERALSERELELSRAGEERDQALAARAAELEAQSARLAEQKRALGDWEEDMVRAAEERNQALAARAAELDAQSARLAEQKRALGDWELLHTPNVVRDDEAAQPPTVDEPEKPAAAQGISPPSIVQRQHARVDLSAFPNIASGYEIGGRSIVARLVDGRSVRITAKYDSATGTFVSEYEVAEPGGLAWIPAPEYETYASRTLEDLLVGALRKVDSGPRSQSEPDRSGHSLSGGEMVADAPAQPDPALEPESAVPQAPTRRRGVWRRARRR